MFRPWPIVLVIAVWGCGIDDRGIHGTAEEEAGVISADATTDAPASGDTAADVALQQLPCPERCPEPANADPVCMSGQCGFVCRRGYHPVAEGCTANEQAGCCGDACIACAAPAHGAAACTNRQCVPSCNAGFHLAGDQCAANDAPACCGPTCATCPGLSHATALCRDGGCDFACDAGYHRDGAACTRDDNAGCCGSACSTCPAPAHATSLCRAGQCSFACEAGFHAAGAGCQLNDDLACCGPGCQTCTPTRANATALCGATGCTDPSPCLPTHHDCNGQCVASDAVASCGAACTPCPERTHATVACDGTACVYACAANFADCDGNPNNGCEANLQIDPMNCGGCATGPKDPHACAGGGSQPQVCVNGQCGCPPGWGNCNGDGSDGCEVNLLTSNVHCGACNPHNPSEADLLTEQAYKAANADPACRVYKLETCQMGHCKGP
jgi:hypothetical protein